MQCLRDLWDIHHKCRDFVLKLQVSIEKSRKEEKSVGKSVVKSVGEPLLLHFSPPATIKPS